MRIAYILNTLETGGAERQVLALAERMHARGHAIRVLACISHAGTVEGNSLEAEK